ncbi:MAG: hypothetical protein HYT03_03180 [Candidatus Harrisonbacteria bacterium]|nr:hypothetical protein [Candidatus Harrisonbacteria bacterium]
MGKKFFIGFGIGLLITAIAVGIFLISRQSQIDEEKNISNNQIPETEFGHLFPDGRYFDLRGLDEVLISIFSNRFHPKHIVIKIGTKVYWKNESDSSQQVSSSFAAINFSLPERNDSKFYFFEKTGTYTYSSPSFSEDAIIIVVESR